MNLVPGYEDYSDQPEHVPDLSEAAPSSVSEVSNAITGQDIARIALMTGAAVLLVVPTVRFAVAGEDMSLAERASYAIGNSCPGREDPISLTGLKFDKVIDCIDIQQNVITIVNLPGLTPRISGDQSKPFTEKETTDLAIASEGFIDKAATSEKRYTVRAVQAPPSVSKAIRKDVDSFRDGDECFTPDAGHPSVAAYVLEEMPELRSSGTIVAIGAILCSAADDSTGKETLNSFGVPTTYRTVGLAFTGTTPQQVDVYATYDSKKDSADNTASVAGTISHEVAHHKGLDHYGNILCKQPSLPVSYDVNQLFSPNNLTAQECRTYEYAEQTDNIMAAGTDLDPNKPIDGLLTDQQEDMFRHGNLDASTIQLEPGEMASIDVRSTDANAAQTVLHQLETPVEIQAEGETYNFDKLLLTAQGRNFNSRRVVASLAAIADGSLRIIDASQMAASPIQPDGKIIISAGNDTYTIANNQGLVTFTRQLR